VAIGEIGFVFFYLTTEAQRAQRGEWEWEAIRGETPDLLPQIAFVEYFFNLLYYSLLIVGFAVMRVQ